MKNSMHKEVFIEEAKNDDKEVEYWKRKAITHNWIHFANWKTQIY
jgi:hypothetical protein